jgi:hypothetical protein
MKILFLVLIILIISISCNKQYDNVHMKDCEGNVYKLEWVVGAVYKISPIDTQAIDTLRYKE